MKATINVICISKSADGQKIGSGISILQDIEVFNKQRVEITPNGYFNKGNELIIEGEKYGVVNVIVRILKDSLEITVEVFPKISL